MVNCFVTVYDQEETLEAGQKIAGLEQLTPLYSGLAFISSPRRAWQQAAALEGLLGSTLSIHTRDDLQKSKRVVVTENTMDGTWFVIDNGVNGDGKNWNLSLNRRP